MTILKRATKTVTRQFGKSTLLLLLITILGGILSGAISMSRAILATEERLLMQVPAVSTIIFDWESATTGWMQPSREEIGAVGNLPYVRVYDFTYRPFFYSADLQWPFVDNPGSLGPRGRPFMGRGVNNPEITDIATGLIYLVDGRTFTQEEIDQNAKVVVVPRDIAVASEVEVGSIIEIENVVYNIFATGDDDTIHASRILEVEVIGLIGHIGWTDTELIYMPIGLAEDMLDFDTQTKLEFDAERYRNVGQGFLQEEPLIESIFVLYSPRYLEPFTLAAADVLPTGWVVAGMDESIFAPVVFAMDMVLQIASGIQWGAIIASICILSLLIILFLRDRRHEIGVYIALGDKKSKIVSQILTEVGLVATVGTILALFVGNIISGVISTYLFEQHLIEQMEMEYFQHDVIPWELALYSPGEMTVEEALELYNVALDFETTLIFINIGMLVTLTSTIIPIWYTLKLEPKDLLLQAKIG